MHEATAHFGSFSLPPQIERVAFFPGFPERGTYRLFGKRLFDIIFSLALMPLVLPVIGLLALLVHLDGGPAFYTHERIGRRGEVFRCYKIRSMTADSDQTLELYLASHPDQAAVWRVHQKLERDPRVTLLGQFLRRTSLDELPQFLNVLRGDMSVVGPRPFLPAQEPTYRSAGGMAYFGLRPGVTGLWQVHARNRSAFVDRVGFDEAYDTRLGLATDLRVILATVGVVLRRTGA